MSIELKITGADPTEFAFQLSGLVALTFPASTKPQPAPTTEVVVTNTPRAGESAEQIAARSAPRGRKAKPAQVDIEEAILASPPKEGDVVATLLLADDPMPADDFDEGKKAPTQQELKDAMLALLAAKGDDAPPAVLAKFGATKLSQVKVSDYARAIKACNLAAAEKGE
jgi:hypothetical protein